VKGLCIGKSRKGNGATGYSNKKAEGNIIKQLFEEYETKSYAKTRRINHHNRKLPLTSAQSFS
jgi:hypothetical protein